MFLIIPNAVRDMINAKLDKIYQELPEAEDEREEHYKIILNYFNEYGEIPEFTIQKENL